MKHPIQSIPLIAALAATGLLAACQTTQTENPKRFDQADTNHDGRLSRGEISDDLVAGVFNGRDTEKDGKLTKAEWSVSGEEKWDKVFRGADASHDGAVTLEEAKAYGRKVAAGNDFFKEADKNRDGFVSREEALAYYGSKEGPVR